MMLAGPDTYQRIIPAGILAEELNEFTIGYLVCISGGNDFQMPLDYNNMFTITVIGDPI